MAGTKEQIDIERMSLDKVVQLFQKLGARDFTRDMLEKDLASGAPQNEDGTVNLFDYGAWLYVGGRV